MNKKKIVISGISIVVLAIAIICTFHFDDQKTGELYPMPDKIIIYHEGSSTEIKNTDDLFEQLYTINHIPERKEILETSIDPDGVEEIKSELAVEYVYYEQQNMKFEEIDRNYHKLLFVYSGWCENNVVFYEDEYQSGTISNSTSKKAVEKIIARVDE